MTARPLHKIDRVIIGCYLFLLVFGWLNIYSSSLGFEEQGFDWQSRYGMQIIWVSTAIALDLLLLFAIPSRFFNVFAWWIYALVLVALVATVFVGKEVNGSRSWLALGPLRIQPAEFSKISVALALSALMEKYNFSFSNFRNFVQAFAVIAIPMLLILLEKETGLMLVYVGFLLMFFREGMSGWLILAIPLAAAVFIATLIFSPYVATVLWFTGVALYAALHSRRMWLIILIAVPAAVLMILGRKLDYVDTVLAVGAAVPALTLIVRSLILRRQKVLRRYLLVGLVGMVLAFSSGFVFNKVLKDHQRIRIEELLNITDDPMGAGYNVHQSMIAIGSGGFYGKGFTQGTQTRFDFVPEQSTDFIFCTVGEEWGFLGSLAVLVCYGILIVRLYNSAEKKRSRFSRIYGYCVASLILIHVTINVGMTVGLMPVIGIPLPMLSYGGSSLWAFSILLFIYLRMDYES